MFPKYLGLVIEHLVMYIQSFLVDHIVAKLHMSQHFLNILTVYILMMNLYSASGMKIIWTFGVGVEGITIRLILDNYRSP